MNNDITPQQLEWLTKYTDADNRAPLAMQDFCPDYLYSVDYDFDCKYPYVLYAYKWGALDIQVMYSRVRRNGSHYGGSITEWGNRAKLKCKGLNRDGFVISRGVMARTLIGRADLDSPEKFDLCLNLHLDGSCYWYAGHEMLDAVRQYIRSHETAMHNVGYWFVACGYDGYEQDLEFVKNLSKKLSKKFVKSL